ncbi:hypothetical protein GCM10011571_23280 [Marinithermofilum abyssi]|uniref:Uncharacterized protein n=1 Tax=Marinithermofilum abyssi TaxID=1571185 RepID=A0A8J2VII5_9BACL|nr:hypothetical protein [Marinithermofilum abyssi]GGE20651.1 hypothetical protein GCM10011571_23280 [Marinithermofilum abyssi]
MDCVMFAAADPVLFSDQKAGNGFLLLTHHTGELLEPLDKFGIVQQSGVLDVYIHSFKMGRPFFKILIRLR